MSNYIGVYLIPESRNNLLEWASRTIGTHDGWQTYAEHLTVKYAPTATDTELLSTKGFVLLRVIGYGADASCQAVVVQSNRLVVGNDVPHITICVKNQRPVYSNTLLSRGWTPVSDGPVLYGRVGERGDVDFSTELKNTIQRIDDNLPPRQHVKPIKVLTKLEKLSNNLARLPPSDVTITTAKGTVLKLHKYVISSKSQYFYDLIYTSGLSSIEFGGKVDDAMIELMSIMYGFEPFECHDFVSTASSYTVALACELRVHDVVNAMLELTMKTVLEVLESPPSLSDMMAYYDQILSPHLTEKQRYKFETLRDRITWRQSLDCTGLLSDGQVACVRDVITRSLRNSQAVLCRKKTEEDYRDAIIARYNNQLASSSPENDEQASTACLSDDEFCQIWTLKLSSLKEPSSDNGFVVDGDQLRQGAMTLIKQYQQSNVLVTSSLLKDLVVFDDYLLLKLLLKPYDAAQRALVFRTLHDIDVSLDASFYEELLVGERICSFVKYGGGDDTADWKIDMQIKGSRVVQLNHHKEDHHHYNDDEYDDCYGDYY